MAYCAQGDIEKQIPSSTVTQLTDDEGTGAKVAERVSEAIARADSLIDSYCAGKYTVPFEAPAPDVVKTLSVDMAIYHLYARRVETMPEVRAQRYKDAVAFLHDLAAGKATLGEIPAPTASGADQVKTSRVAGDRIFTTGRSSTGSVGSLDNF